MSPRRYAVVAGGGTGGHVFRRSAIARGAASAGAHDRRPSSSSAPAAARRARCWRPRASAYCCCPGGGSRASWRSRRRSRTWGRSSALAVATRAARPFVASLAPAVVVSVGGYAAFPAGLAAVVLRIPLVLVNSTPRPGWSTGCSARSPRRARWRSPAPRCAARSSPARRSARRSCRSTARRRCGRRPTGPGPPAGPPRRRGGRRVARRRGGQRRGLVVGRAVGATGPTSPCTTSPGAGTSRSVDGPSTPGRVGGPRRPRVCATGWSPFEEDMAARVPAAATSRSPGRRHDRGRAGRWPASRRCSCRCPARPATTRAPTPGRSPTPGRPWLVARRRDCDGRGLAGVLERAARRPRPPRADGPAAAGPSRRPDAAEPGRRGGARPMPADARGAARPRRRCRVHVVGVGGAGMSAIAVGARRPGPPRDRERPRGLAVDRPARAAGIAVAVGHARPNTWATPTSSRPRRPCRRTTPSWPRPRARGIPVVRRAEVLAAIAGTRRCVAVAGTHGKTTTSSMLALVLAEAGLRPSFLIGADVGELGANARLGRGASGSSSRPTRATGPSRALDPALARAHERRARPPRPLRHASRRCRRRSTAARGAGAAAVVGADDPVRGRARRRASARAASGADAARDVRHASTWRSIRSAVALRPRAAPTGRSGRLEVPVPGAHNARNAALAAAAALVRGVRVRRASSSALARFAGVPRRFEFRGEAGGVTFVDDYAHLPGEVRAVARDRPRRRLGPGRGGVPAAPLHPDRRAGGRVRPAPSTDADVVVVTDVYAAGEPPVPGVPGRLVADAIAAADPAAAGALRAGPRRARRRWSPPLLGPATSAHPGGGRPHHASRRAAGARRHGERRRRGGPRRAGSATWPSATRRSARSPPTASAGPPRSSSRPAPRGPRWRVAAPSPAGTCRCSSSGGAPTCSSPTPASPGSPCAWRPGVRADRLAIVRGPPTGPCRPRRGRRSGSRCSPAARSRPGLTGLEWAVGVPGSVGGAVRMNAGGHGSDVAAASLPLPMVRPRQPAPAGEDASSGSRSATAPRRSGPTEVVVLGRVRRRDAAIVDAGRARAGRDRAVAAGAPARRAQRRLGVHQPAGRPAGAAHRGGRRRRAAAWAPPGLGQARQLHPGRRRTARADDVRAPHRRRAERGRRRGSGVRLSHRGPPRRVRGDETGGAAAPAAEPEERDAHQHGPRPEERRGRRVPAGPTRPAAGQSADRPPPAPAQGGGRRRRAPRLAVLLTLVACAGLVAGGWYPLALAVVLGPGQSRSWARPRRRTPSVIAAAGLANARRCSPSTRARRRSASSASVGGLGHRRRALARRRGDQVRRAHAGRGGGPRRRPRRSGVGRGRPDGSGGGAVSPRPLPGSRT